VPALDVNTPTKVRRQKAAEDRRGLRHEFEARFREVGTAAE
jgi:hypothetical protein